MKRLLSRGSCFRARCSYPRSASRKLRADFLRARRLAARRRSLHRSPDHGRHAPACRWPRVSATWRTSRPPTSRGPDQYADEDRSSPQLARRVHVSDVHRGHRDGCGEAVRPRHAPARQPRQDRRDRDPVDHDGLLAVQRRQLSEVFVRGRLGPDSGRTSAIRAPRSSPPPTPTSMRFSKARSTWCRGASRASASKAACTPAKDSPD